MGISRATLLSFHFANMIKDFYLTDILLALVQNAVTTGLTVTNAKNAEHHLMQLI